RRVATGRCALTRPSTAKDEVASDQIQIPWAALDSWRAPSIEEGRPGKTPCSLRRRGMAAPRVYVDRTAGRHRDHRHPCRHAAPSLVEGKRKEQANQGH